MAYSFGRRLRAHEPLHFLHRRCGCGVDCFVFYSRRGYSGDDSWSAAVKCPVCAAKVTAVAIPDTGGLVAFAAGELPSAYLGRLPLRAALRPWMPLRLRVRLLAGAPVVWLLLCGLVAAALLCC